jgi:hypothetical protein
MLSPESAPHTGDLPGTPNVISPAMNGEREERETGEIRTISDGSVISGTFADAVERAVIGLGIAFPGDPSRGDVGFLSFYRCVVMVVDRHLCGRIDQLNW